MTRFTFQPLKNSGIDFGKWRKGEMIKTLESPLYWIKPERLTLWNIELIRDLYLVNNGDRNAEGHKRLIEEYLGTLPKSA